MPVLPIIDLVELLKKSAKDAHELRQRAHAEAAVKAQPLESTPPPAHAGPYGPNASRPKG